MWVTLSLSIKNGLVRLKGFQAQDKELVDLPQNMGFPTFLEYVLSRTNLAY